MGLLNATSTRNTDASEAPTVPAGDSAPAAITGHRRLWRERSIGRWKWQIRADWARLFDADSCPDWLHLDRDARATLVKANDGRQVWRVQLGRRVVFVKVSRPPRRWARWRRVLAGSDATRERRIADYAAQHGINTVSPVALGDAPIHGRRPTSILVTVGLPDARPLNEFWAALDPRQPGTRRIKNEVIDAVARLIAHGHQNGFEHFDLHAGNILVEPGNHGGRRAFFVDLHNIRTGRAVSDERATRNLAQFNQWFSLRGLLSDRVRFLNRYLYWRDAVESNSAYGRRLGGDRRDLVRSVERAALVHANALYAKRDRRGMRSGRYFTKLKLRDGWRAHVFLESKHRVPGSRVSELTFRPEQWRQWLERPSDLVGTADQRYLIKDSATAVVCRARLPLDTGEPLDVLCKRATSRSLIKRVQNTFRTSRPMLTWKRANALLNRQVPTARPLAVVERRRFGLLLDSLLITEYIEHARDLDTILTVEMREMGPGQQRRLKRHLIESLATLVRRLHDRGFSHRDFKAPNIIVQWDPQSEGLRRITLVDLDGLRRFRGPGRRARMSMLMRLNVSLDHCRRVTQTDRLRFLKRYLERFGRPARPWKPVWRELAALSERKRRENARQQQQLLAKYGRF